MKWLTVLVVVILVLVACAPQPIIDGTTKLVGSKTTVSRYIDEPAGIVCWIFSGYDGKGGISCLPIDQTLLGKE